MQCGDTVLFMGRNRLDFVRPGTVAGQVAEVRFLAGNEHTHYRDGPNCEPIAYTVPGVDTEVTLSGHPFIYRVRAITSQDGAQVAELHIDSPEHDVPLTAADLRKLARYLDRLAYVAANRNEMVALLDSARFHQPEKAPPKRPGRRGHPDSFYADVAEFAKQVHRERNGSGVSVRAAVAAHYGVTKNTADKWLARARKAGHLKAGDLGGQPKSRKSAKTTTEQENQ
jgi:hypothetical protein